MNKLAVLAVLGAGLWVSAENVSALVNCSSWTQVCRGCGGTVTTCSPSMATCVMSPPPQFCIPVVSNACRNSAGTPTITNVGTTFTVTCQTP